MIIDTVIIFCFYLYSPPDSFAMAIIFGAQYEASGRLYRLLGAKTGRLVFQDEATGEIVEEPRAGEARFQPTGVHDHAEFCCPEHNLHVSPHRGCILR